MYEPLPHQHVVFIVAIAVAALAAFSDWKRGEIPNWLTYGALGVAPLLHVGRMLVAHNAVESALAEGGYSILGAIVAVIVPAMLYRQGAIGGGDLKLLAALGALLQTTLGIEAEMYGFFAAALFAPARLAYEGKLVVTVKNAFTILVNLFLPKSKQRHVEETALSWFRLGPPLLLGVVLTVYLHW
jgi:prepilin peptidase CpaA